MARPQTIFSELHLALSVSGTDKLRLIENVDKDIELVYQKEYAKRIKDKKNRICPLEVAGSRIRSYLLNNHVDPVSVKWTGRNKLGSFTSMSKDIQVADTVRISVKEDADVFINGSPE